MPLAGRENQIFSRLRRAEHYNFKGKLSLAGRETLIFRACGGLNDTFFKDIATFLFNGPIRGQIYVQTLPFHSQTLPEAQNWRGCNLWI